MNGLLVIYKEKDYTSHDVVNIIKRKYKVKSGHTGTLDPNACGVLVICIGNATKLSAEIMDNNKTYIAEVHFGKETDTYDITGNIIEEKKVNFSHDDLNKALGNFTGEFLQTPPIYSAIKVSGKKLYEYARQGKEIELQQRKVFVKNIELLSFENDIAKVKLECSKGFYVRSFCHDLGQALNTVACMGDLLRTANGQFTLEQSYKIDELGDEQEFLQKIIPIESIYNYPKINIKQEYIKYLNNGNELLFSYFACDFNSSNRFFVCVEDEIRAIYEKKLDERKLKLVNWV